MTDALSDLAQQWVDACGSAGAVVLKRLDELPKLRQAFELGPGASPVVAGESYVHWNGSSLEGAFLVAWKTDEQGVRVGTTRLDFDTAEGTASLEDMHLHPDLQTKGVGRQVVQQFSELADALGLHSLITMTSDVGRYSWARCGFDFLHDHDRELALAAAEHIAGKLGANFDVSNIDHSWELAELDGPDVPLAAIAELRGESPPTDDAPGMRFGQALLLGPTGNEWAGCLDLSEGSLSRMKVNDGSPS